MNKNKDNKKLLISPELTKDLNHWRDQLLSLDKTYYSQDNDKLRTIKNMLNKYLDDVLDYNKKNKEKSQTKV